MDAESQIAETLKHAPGLVRRKANVSIFTINYITDNMCQGVSVTSPVTTLTCSRSPHH